MTMDKDNKQIAVILGSKSDLPAMDGLKNTLDSLGVGYDLRIISAHRTPDVAVSFAKGARDAGYKVLIAVAGFAAHLGGVIASHTTLPVIGVPLNSSPLNGIDSLLSTVMMPPGVPVACMGIGSSGATNAALYAVEILAITDTELQLKLAEYRRLMSQKVIQADQEL